MKQSAATLTHLLTVLTHPVLEPIKRHVLERDLSISDKNFSDGGIRPTIATGICQINFLSIGTIFLCVALSVWSLRICYKGRDAASEKLDLWAMIVIGIAYVAANAVIVCMNL